MSDIQKEFESIHIDLDT